MLIYSHYDVKLNSTHSARVTGIMEGDATTLVLDTVVNESSLYSMGSEC